LCCVQSVPGRCCTVLIATPLEDTKHRITIFHPLDVMKPELSAGTSRVRPLAAVVLGATSHEARLRRIAPSAAVAAGIRCELDRGALARMGSDPPVCCVPRAGTEGYIALRYFWRSRDGDR